MQIPESDKNLIETPYKIEKDFKLIANQAAKTIAALQNSETGGFWRSTEHRKKDGAKHDKELFPTVTFASLEALIFYLYQYPEWAKKDHSDTDIAQSVTAILNADQDKIKSSHNNASSNGLNPFTLARYIHVLAALFINEILSIDQKKGAKEIIEKAFDSIIKNVNDGLSNQWHPFVLYHIVRAIQLCYPFIDEKEDLCRNLREIEIIIHEQVRNITLNLLAQRYIEGLAGSDAIALGFCAAILSRININQDQKLIMVSLDACFASQDLAGCWPQGRVILDNNDSGAQPLVISTYEIAWVLSETLISLVSNRTLATNYPGYQSFIQKLLQTLNYTQQSMEHLTKQQIDNMTDKEPAIGWCADHKYNLPLVESWTTASVLLFVIKLYELVQIANRQLIIRSFPSIDPLIDDWPEWRCWANYKIENEPEEEIHVLDYLDRNIVHPILQNKKNLPQKDEKDVSVLLFGPSGTHKTSIVLAIAEALKWPVITLSPGIFIEKGLEYIEAQANYVFSRLSLLTQTVILFDECDELFRDRKPEENTEQTRAITAFVTASMLPKLQNLHDSGKILFFICTNQIESMDKAAFRGGRIDHIVGIGSPDENARTLIIMRDFEKISKSDSIKLDSASQKEKVQAMIVFLARETERFTSHELDWICNILYPRIKDIEKNQIEQEVKQLVESMKNSLTITVDDNEKFKESIAKYSRPHIEGRKPL